MKTLAQFLAVLLYVASIPYAWASSRDSLVIQLKDGNGQGSLTSENDFFICDDLRKQTLEALRARYNLNLLIVNSYCRKHDGAWTIVIGRVPQGDENFLETLIPVVQIRDEITNGNEFLGVRVVTVQEARTRTVLGLDQDDNIVLREFTYTVDQDVTKSFTIDLSVYEQNRESQKRIVLSQFNQGRAIPGLVASFATWRPESNQLITAAISLVKVGSSHECDKVFESEE